MTGEKQSIGVGRWKAAMIRCLVCIGICRCFWGKYWRAIWRMFEMFWSFSVLSPPMGGSSAVLLTPGRTRNIAQDMEALRLSRQDNPYLQVGLFLHTSGLCTYVSAHWLSGCGIRGSNIKQARNESDSYDNYCIITETGIVFYDSLCC